MSASIIYLIAIIINSVILTCNGYNAMTLTWWVSTLCIVAANLAGRSI